MLPRRRPPRDGLAANNLIIFAAVVLLLPWLIDADSVLQRQKSPHEAQEARRLEVTKIAQNFETPYAPGRRKNTLSVNNDKKDVINDASAIATLAPAERSAVAAPPTRQTSNAGLASPQIARNLEDWEVEDFVLLATIDGQLHARDRKTGKELWNLVYEKPMVETIYHRKNRSSVEEGYEVSTVDDFLWIVEPSRDGSIFILKTGGPDRGLLSTGLTMKKIVEELSPYGGEDPYVTYTGEKKTSMITLDSKTGDVVKFFGIGGNLANSDNARRCVKSNAFLDKGECPSNATLTIGRTEYTVAIQDRSSGEQIATLTFSEWSTNNYDRDLQNQYRSTLDKKYIHARHDGSIFALYHGPESSEEPRRLFTHKFSSPVARVFDVARPWGTEKEDPELVVLAQPVPPQGNDDYLQPRPSSSIFLNHTEDGSWYAMSGKLYPFAVQGRQADYSNQEWIQNHPDWDSTDDFNLKEALVGLHSIENLRHEKFLSISGTRNDDNVSEKIFDTEVSAIVEPSSIVSKLQAIPGKAAVTFMNFILNPTWILFAALFIFVNQRQIKTWIRQFGDQLKSKPQFGPVREVIKESHLETHEKTPSELPSSSEPKDSLPRQPTSEDKNEDKDASEEMDVVEVAAQPKSDANEEQDKVVVPEKKKAHRGRRGGVKHRKGPRSNSDPPQVVPKPPPTIDETVREAQNLGQKTRLEPDIKTLPSNPAEVSGPIIRVGALEVNTDKLIGTGSNGTMVFQGNFDGRDVAVKRMLIQFFDIASQETKLLRESDDHPNVIRYYAQQQAAGFLYIALELCPASLADVIEKPHLHRALAQGGEKDLPNVLYQITNGLQHLHNLRIVHRDLKPQNILVAMGANGLPRLLVSDFGLCKKLEGEQSSFRATTAHAAGTSGWRAPELLLDDDAKQGSSMVDASTDGNSGPLVDADLMPNRRATRAIDIFSLGLVFFYVLTKGSHPFDCGDRYMREVNIRKGNHSLDLLRVLGDYYYEAADIIGSMLVPNPKARPSARHVLAHPFFWSAKKRLNFLCDVSDHFEKEKRDPPTWALQQLESYAPGTCGADFLKPLGKEFVESMGRQRKYTGTRLLDLLRALRNKKNHYEDMSDHLKEHVGPLPDGYLSFWTRKFPSLLLDCWNVVYEVGWDDTDRFKEYYQPAGLQSRD